jgi:aminotransferase
MTTPAPSISRRVSRKASKFTESVIREMTREAMKHGAINLSQGFPDFAAPEDIKRVAMQAIADDVNQYAITWGAKGFREAIARVRRNGTWDLRLIPAEITVTCGSTEE